MMALNRSPLGMACAGRITSLPGFWLNHTAKAISVLDTACARVAVGLSGEPWQLEAVGREIAARLEERQRAKALLADGVPQIKLLGRYVRDEHLLTLEEAIRKMTSLPAQSTPRKLINVCSMASGAR